MKKIIKRLRVNMPYVIIGSSESLKGLLLLTQRKFFFYPPSWTWLMDNPIFDGLMAILGALLIAYIISPSNRNKVLGLLLGSIASTQAIVTSLELEHIFFAGRIVFWADVLNEVISLAWIFWTARHFSKR